MATKTIAKNWTVSMGRQFTIISNTVSLSTSFGSQDGSVPIILNLKPLNYERWPIMYVRNLMKAQNNNPYMISEFRQ